MEEEGATSILPLMGVDQAILHSIDKCSECPVWGGDGGGGMVEEGTTGILPLMVEDQAIQQHVNKCGCVYEVGRGVEGRGDGGGGCHRHLAADRCGPGRSEQCEQVCDSWNSVVRMCVCAVECWNTVWSGCV